MLHTYNARFSHLVLCRRSAVQNSAVPCKLVIEDRNALGLPGTRLDVTTSSGPCGRTHNVKIQRYGHRPMLLNLARTNPQCLRSGGAD